MNREVIIACDFSSFEEFKQFLNKFDEKLFLKIGMELFYKEGIKVVEYAKKIGHKVFLDLKLHDIPNTVYKALLNIKQYDVEFVTVHASGGREMLKACKEALDNSNTKILAVTVLTSIDQKALNELNIKVGVEEQVIQLASVVKECGIEYIVCSPNEVTVIKEELGLKCVTPGIRMIDDEHGDQKRVTTPKQAYLNGSDYIVVGRSITNSDDVVSAYNECVKQFGGYDE